MLAEFMRKEGQQEAAALVETSMDLYLRQGEWEALKAQDVFDDGQSISFVLGVSERGERVKTGHNQGVVLDSIALTKEWRAKLRTHSPSKPLFFLNPQQLNDIWSDAKVKLGLSHLGPLHDLRHAGAARDIESKLRSLEEVRRRGRWKTLDSVQRHTKTFLLVKARSLLTKATLQHGNQLKSVHGARVLHA